MDMMKESFQYWNSVLRRLMSFRFCLKLINSMQGRSDIFFLFYMLFSLTWLHFYFTIKCLRSKQKLRYMYRFQTKHTNNLLWLERPEAHWPQWMAHLSTLDFQLPWQQIKMRTFYNIFLLDGGLLNKHV